MLEEMMMNIDTLITENRTILHRMRDLNMRAGTEVFPLPKPEDLQRRFAAGLKGARCVREIIDWDALRLPSLDQSVVNNVLAGCPDTITVLGMAVKVEYESPYGGIAPHPHIKLPSSLINGQRWLELPDEGVRLPSGRIVAVGFYATGYSDFVGDTDILALKKKVRDSLNRGLWERWNKPELPTPIDAIAPIEERQYGRCVVTEVPLIAYGTVRRSWSSWTTFWSRDRVEVEQLRDESCRRFAEVQEESRRAELMKRVGELYRQHRDTVPEALRNRMYHAIYGYNRQSVAEIETIVVEVEALQKPRIETVDPNKVDLSQLFGGRARVTR